MIPSWSGFRRLNATRVGRRQVQRRSLEVNLPNLTKPQKRTVRIAGVTYRASARTWRGANISTPKISFPVRRLHASGMCLLIFFYVYLLQISSIPLA